MSGLALRRKITCTPQSAVPNLACDQQPLAPSWNASLLTINSSFVLDRECVARRGGARRHLLIASTLIAGYGVPANDCLSKRIPRAPVMVQCQSNDCCSKARRKRITCFWCKTEACSATARQIYHCEIVECGRTGGGIIMED